MNRNQFEIALDGDDKTLNAYLETASTTEIRQAVAEIKRKYSTPEITELKDKLIALIRNA